MSQPDPTPDAAQSLEDAAHAVVRAYTAEAEDWNDGEFALWRKDDLVNALVALRVVVAETCADPICPDHGDPDNAVPDDGSFRG